MLNMKHDNVYYVSILAVYGRIFSKSKKQERGAKELLNFVSTWYKRLYKKCEDLQHKLVLEIHLQHGRLYLAYRTSFICTLVWSPTRKLSRRFDTQRYSTWWQGSESHYEPIIEPRRNYKMVGILRCRERSSSRCVVGPKK